MLSVQANNADGCQWLRNGVPLDGQTNSILAIASAGINDVGLYSCEVFNGGEMVPTRAASVEVETAANATAASVTAARPTVASATVARPAAAGVTANGVLGGGPIVVSGTPILSSGYKNNCPGAYVGYVAYTKAVSQGWGWAPIAGAPIISAADGSGRTDTKIEYVGAYGDHGCGQTSISINPAYSPVYRFTIYFTNNIPTNAYSIVLTGFNP